MRANFKLTTAVAGTIGTVLAAIGLLERFPAFLFLMSVLVAPLASFNIADYRIIFKRKKRGRKCLCQ